MINFNVNIPTKEFFDSYQTPLTQIPTTEDIWYNVDGDASFTIEISGADNIECTVEGCMFAYNLQGEKIPAEEMPFTQIKIIDFSQFKLIDKITKNGLYCVGAIGLAAIRVKITSLSGKVTILGSTGIDHFGGK